MSEFMKDSWDKYKNQYVMVSFRDGDNYRDVSKSRVIDQFKYDYGLRRFIKTTILKPIQRTL